MSSEHAAERSKIRSIRASNPHDADEPLRPLPHQLYRFDDLKQREIVNNRAQLEKMIAAG